MAVTRRRGRRRLPSRTAEFRAYEALGLALGLALGRAIARDADLHVAVIAGVTRAIRERDAGRPFRVADVHTAIRDADEAIAELRASTSMSKVVAGCR